MYTHVYAKMAPQGGGGGIHINYLSQPAGKKNTGRGSSNFYDPRISCLRLGVKSGESSKKGQHFTKYSKYMHCCLESQRQLFSNVQINVNNKSSIQLVHH